MPTTPVFLRQGESPGINSFSILGDTLVGQMLPAWRPEFKVREAAQQKFYWFDPGVARAAAGLIRDPADSL